MFSNLLTRYRNIGNWLCPSRRCSVRVWLSSWLILRNVLNRRTSPCQRGSVWFGNWRLTNLRHILEGRSFSDRRLMCLANGSLPDSCHVFRCRPWGSSCFVEFSLGRLSDGGNVQCSDGLVWRSRPSHNWLNWFVRLSNMRDRSCRGSSMITDRFRRRLVDAVCTVMVHSRSCSGLLHFDFSWWRPNFINSINPPLLSFDLSDFPGLRNRRDGSLGHVLFEVLLHQFHPSLLIRDPFRFSRLREVSTFSRLELLALFCDDCLLNRVADLFVQLFL